MLWLFLAMASRLFWAGTNFVEQLLSRSFEGQSPFAPIVLIWIFSLPFSLICFVMSGMAAWNGSVLLYSWGAAVAVVGGIIPYFYVLRREQANNVIPYLELTPVFVILLAVVVKQQLLSEQQSLGAFLIVASSFLFSWDFQEGRFKFRTLAFLTGASFCFGTFQFCVAEAEAHSSFWVATGCYLFGQFVLSLLLLGLSKDIRQHVWQTCSAQKGRPLLWGCFIGVSDFLALLALLAAFKRAPSYGHVAALSGLQSVFCFLIAIPLGRRWPQIFTPIRFDREQNVKLLLIGTIFAGVYLLAR